MTGDRIELSDEEWGAAKAALSLWCCRKCGGALVNYSSALVGIVDAVNRVRQGDPVGTVRRHPDGSRIVIRVMVNQPEGSTTYVSRWVHVNLTCGVMSRHADHPTPDWPIVLSPEVS
jgi:hypothetical protein